MSSNSIGTLQLALTNVNNLIASITANPKPSYSINGQSVSWGEYLKQLLDAQADINQKIVVATGPDEYVMEGAT